MKGIREFRVANGLTQSQLGDYLGVGKSFLSSIETGRAKLPPEKFSKLLNNDQGWDTSMLIADLSNSPSIKIGNVTATVSSSGSDSSELAALRAENESLRAQVDRLTKIIENLTSK